MARTNVAAWFSSVTRSGWMVHSARTAVGTVVSLVVARLFEMPEAYWAAITTMILMESTLGTAWSVSKQRLIGTALGAAAGGFLASSLRPDIALFGAAIFALGLMCAILRLDRSAYRFAGITLTIVVLVTRGEGPWVIALHRFIEVSIGIAVALALTALWPEREWASGRK